ncbi:4Fe-4S ferredoxin-type, iron-sulphur binding domain protein [Acididesulfobacillus acetoxydans]|uniref:4Fe-4S ferredoxin-type iron-sulfur binding domain profile n=1 Tax=Acididesulfobacillus acetoxydans TaxID=1561005 RepID=A0A8S0WLE8_9FIRM|nr:4Fe-4S binding protein [Acididesulfobacillus acetoxydans]CAA7599974.1 4Fe-4S ferredoxin-type, iron-sulphur binding domain protein [Acididesulfobacillus acetoxydans]CEJ07934.1 4Fe-4S ferredoxin-type iron-sulfur binding domain profile [Acididesulfobacillus acetoxydans]
MANNHVEIKTERCKGCGLCVSVCPKKVLEIGETANSKGYYAVIMQDEDKCIGCAFCALMCPDLALEVYRAEKGE